MAVKFGVEGEAEVDGRGREGPASVVEETLAEELGTAAGVEGDEGVGGQGRVGE